MDPQLIQQLINLFKEASPHMWDILMREVYAEIAGFAIYSSIGVGLLVLGRKAYTKVRAADDKETKLVLSILTVCCIGAGVLFTVLNVTEIVVRLINPEFYAVMSIITRLPK